MSLKKVLSLLLFVTIIVLPVFSASAVETPSEYTNRQNELNNQVKSIEDNLKKNSKDISDQEKRINELNRKLSELSASMNTLSEEIRGCNEDIEIMEGDISDLEIKVEDSYVVLGKRIKEIYMSGETSNLEILLGAKTFEELIDKMNLVGFISAHDQKLITQLKDNITDINSSKDRVEAKKALTENKKRALETSALEYESYVKEANLLMEELKKTNEDYAKQLEEKEKEKEKLSEEIAQWHKDYVKKQQEEAAKKAAAEAAAAAAAATASQNSSTSSSSGTSSGTIYNNSSNTAYGWPAPECNVVTAYWGDGRDHHGVDLACSGSAYGKPIVAAASGTVIKVEYLDSGWGYHIMIDHGNGYATQYAHCSYIAVKVGQTVVQGEYIGDIGNTGYSFGPHLHFECWYNGTRYDPAPSLGL